MTSIRQKIKKVLGIRDLSEFNSIGKDIRFIDEYKDYDGHSMSIDADDRYNTPKEKHKASEEEIDHILATTPLYQKANQRLNKGQKGQIGYGIDKYPEPLNADTWTIFETLDHIMDESIDKMHYMEMLREKFGALIKENEELRDYKERSESTSLVKELMGLRTFKATIEQMGGAPFKVYSDNFVYPHTMSGADHDGDYSPLKGTGFFVDDEEIRVVQYPQSDINFHNSQKVAEEYVEQEEESTYIKMCRKATEIVEGQEKMEKYLIDSRVELREEFKVLRDNLLVHPPKSEPITKSMAIDIANEIHRLEKQRHTTGMGF